MRWFDFLKKWFTRLHPVNKMAADEIAVMRGILMGVKHTVEVELSCDQVYELVDQYVEMVARGEDAAAKLPLVRAHLDHCIECREEYEVLLSLIENSLAS